MTDYEYEFATMNEIQGSVPVGNFTNLEPIIEEPWPQTNALIEINNLEKIPKNATSLTHRYL